MKNKLIKIISLIIIWLLLFSFIKINSTNYKKYREIKSTIVNHPEFLPTKEVDKLTSFWFSNIKADLYWLNAIQYIWSNAIGSEYKKYLFEMIDLITELNPYFEHPYLIWELLLPSYNYRYENLSDTEINNNIDEWIKLWLKWIKNYCDLEKVNLIKEEYDLNKLWTDEKYKDPCKSHMIPYYLAYIYFYYKKNWLEAAKYYKVASANSDSLEWSKLMAALMQWKWWDREKSVLMLLNLAKNIPSSDECIAFSNELEKISFWIFRWQIPLSWEIIKNIEDTRNKIFNIWLDNQDDKDFLDDTKCKSYALKATRELNLFYIEQANKLYIRENNKNSSNAKELFDKWYMDFLPTDYQQSKDYWIIYFYNKETKFYDYEMWNY